MKGLLAEAVISVSLLFAGMALNKRHTVMHQDVHGELLIEMEDNIYCRDLTMVVIFYHCFFI